MHQFTFNISNVSNRLKFKKADAKRITQKLEKKKKKKNRASAVSSKDLIFGINVQLQLPVTSSVFRTVSDI